MKIKDILGINNARLIIGNEEEILNNFSKDTRTIKKGDTYIGLRGDIYDGNLFYLEAFSKGAKTCIISGLEIDKEKIKEYSNINIILVDNSLEFLKEIAKKKRITSNIPIIAVTGSVGKTSTKNIIADILSTKYKVLKTEGNLNTDIGLALTLLSLTDEEIVVLEMGMSSLGEISTLTNIALPDVAIITNIGTSHIGNLGSRENILKAKLEILEGLKGPLIINNDNDLLNLWHNNETINNEVITFGIDNKSDYQANNINYDNKGSRFLINNKEVKINVIGKHFIYNALVAFIIGNLFKVEQEKIITKLTNLTLEPNRMELINKDNYTIINDTYNASYDSVYYGLEVIKSFNQRKIVVLGDILELGDFSEQIHKNIGKLINSNYVDFLITVGNFSKYINEEAKNLGYPKEQCKHFKNNDDAIKYINSIKSINDIIYVKASHGMNFIEIVKNI